MLRGGRRPAAALLLLCWAAGGAAQVHERASDGFCKTHVVVDASGVVSTASTAGEAGAVLLATPPHNQTFKVAANRITASSHDLTREYVTFHVFVEEGTVVDFEYGSKILDDSDGDASWCQGLPQHPLFKDETCTPGARKRNVKIGGLDAYIVTVTTDMSSDSGEMRDEESRVCFTQPPPGGKRCVYLRAIQAPEAPIIYVDGVGGTTNERDYSNNVLIAYVGNDASLPPAKQGLETLLEVRAVSSSRALQVEIDFAKLRSMRDRVYAELPGQRWLGPTTCRTTGSIHGPCDEWTRTLHYVPTVVETDKRYHVSFQASTLFPEANDFSVPEGVTGIACTGEVGVCANGTNAATLMDKVDTTVRVVEFKPKFLFSRREHVFIMDETGGGTGAGQLLKAVPNRTVPFLDPPVTANPVIKCANEPASAISASETYPESCIGLPGTARPHPAYANCPMRPFSMVAEIFCEGAPSGQGTWTLPPVCADKTKDQGGNLLGEEQRKASKAAITAETAKLQFSIASAKSTKGGKDAVALGLRLSERLFIQEPVKELGQDSTASSANSDVKFLAHTAVMWTPPLEAMGSVFDVCVDVRSAIASARRCVAVEVLSCFYCTAHSETLHTIAAKFQTNWMQLWSANHERMDEKLDIDPVGNTPWKDTKNPNYIKPGSLIRLGPVYHLPVRTEVPWLLEEFRTSRKSLMLANPSMPPAASHVEAGDSVCVLPDICTQEEEEWMRPASKDSLFP